MSKSVKQGERGVGAGPQRGHAPGVRRWVLALAVATAGLATLAAPVPQAVVHAADRPQELASVEQLKSEAFKALRGGNFDRTNELLAKAASMSGDPSLAQMASWTSQFETQREGFVAERRKQYQKAVDDVLLLLKNDKDDYAVDLASRAYLLADDKDKFNNEPWVKELVANAAKRADGYEASEKWLKALRLYSDLGAVEPANPEWKEKLKLATRRIRLLALYTPDQLKAVQKSESKERDEVDALLHPATQPATNPTTHPLADENGADGFRTDWHETLKGIQYDMLKDALVDSQKYYWRTVSYRDLALGGINGLRAVATTKGLEKAFPGLADETQRQAFLTALDQDARDVKNAENANDRSIAYSVLAKVKSANRQTINLPEEVWVSEFADGAFAELDPFSSMIWPSDVEEFNKTTQGEFSGVGIQIQSDPDGSLKVVSPLEDSPAYKAGIKAGDIITQIDGKNAKGITLNQAVRTITGPEGTPVVLTVRSPDATVKDYTIRRETIKVASIKGWLHKPGGGWNYFVDPAQKIGYLRITNFTKTTGDDLASAVDEMKGQGAKALIIDLRYNPGGLLNAATDVCDKFLTDGVIVSTRPDREELMDSRTEIKARDDGNEFKLPVVVLVNQYSASASEIVSGALKDDKRALIVGERTFGKGSVQMLFPLDNRQAFLKLTTSHYYLPNGRCIHREENSTEWGVDPDVTVEMTPEQMSAAIVARQELDVLHDADPTPAEGKHEKLKENAPKVKQAADAATTQPRKGPLQTDPQLSAALLLLRLQLVGAQL